MKNWSREQILSTLGQPDREFVMRGMPVMIFPCTCVAAQLLPRELDEIWAIFPCKKDRGKLGDGLTE
jgi:hypothetical protein